MDMGTNALGKRSSLLALVESRVPDILTEYAETGHAQTPMVCHNVPRPRGLQPRLFLFLFLFWHEKESGRTHRSKVTPDAVRSPSGCRGYSHTSWRQPCLIRHACVAALHCIFASFLFPVALKTFFLKSEYGVLQTVCVSCRYALQHIWKIFFLLNFSFLFSWLSLLIG